jgi:transcription initiation factor TFIID subunit TAF12
MFSFLWEQEFLVPHAVGRGWKLASPNSKNSKLARLVYKPRAAVAACSVTCTAAGCCLGISRETDKKQQQGPHLTEQQQQQEQQQQKSEQQSKRVVTEEAYHDSCRTQGKQPWPTAAASVVVKLL